MKIIRKIMATATAAACVVAFNTVAVSSAFAADNGEVTVAITIINNDDPNDPEIFRNCYVTVSEGATVGDALYEAGFDKVDTLEETAENPIPPTPQATTTPTSTARTTTKRRASTGSTCTTAKWTWMAIPL